MTRATFILFLMISGLLLTSDGQGLLQTDINEINRRAMAAYQAGQYEEAIRNYQKLYDEGQVSGDLFYNMGNSYYHLGSLGRAILYYEKAMRLTPRDADLRANMAFVKARLGYPYETENLRLSLLRPVFFWNPFFTLRELTLILGIALTLLFSMATAALFFRRISLRWGLLCVGLSSLILGASLAVKIYDQHAIKWAVILEKKVGVKPSFMEGQKAWFSLQEGDRVRVLSQEKVGEKTWLQVEVRGRQKGWILREEGGII